MRIFSMIVIFILISCSKYNGSGLSIYGGERTNEWNSVVAIASGEKIICTGSALTRNVILTAAHCINDNLPIEIIAASEIGSAAESARFTPSGVIFPEKYRFPDGWKDVGLIHLKRNIPLSDDDFIKVISASEEEEALKENTPVTMVGFGLTENGNMGERFQVEASITHVESNELSIGGDGRDTCQGDSGAPVLVKTTNGLRILAVTSRGKVCGRGGKYSRITKIACWLESQSGINFECND